MPKARIAWSCWNYLTKSVTDQAGNYLPNVNQVSLYVHNFEIPSSLLIVLTIQNV